VTVTPPTRLRSLLFAPGGRADVLAKLPRAGPDGVVLDLEDAVPSHAKDDARVIVARVASDLVANHPELAVYVRVNAVPSIWFDDDLKAALVPGLAGVVVPKLESAEQVAWVAESLRSAGHDDLGIVAGIETAAGVANVKRVLDTPVTVVYFGAEDFIADMGGVRSDQGDEVLFARSQVVLAARLAGVYPLDQVVPSFRDDEQFRTDARAGRALGYRGKLLIHPAQVPLAHECFSPSADEVERARRLLDAYEQAVARGEAAIDFEGQMVDEPLAMQARSIIAGGS
jgi:citrate lyase subunit beta/citryl-CoA lyase